MSVGAASAASFVYCMTRTSGFARSSHHESLPSRAFNEFTFHVAMRIELEDYDVRRENVQRVSRGPVHAWKAEVI